MCPHAGGIGLCEMVQHLQMWDYVCLSGTTENRMIEYVDQQHEYFEDPVEIINGSYMIPKKSGYSTKMLNKSLIDFEYPNGKEWLRLFKEGIFPRPVD